MSAPNMALSDYYFKLAADDEREWSRIRALQRKETDDAGRYVPRMFLLRARASSRRKRARLALGHDS